MRRLPKWRDLPVAVRRGSQSVLLLALWQIYVTRLDVDPLVFPAPADVGRALLAGWTTGDLARATGATLWLLLLSLAFGGLLGLAFAVMSRLTVFADDAIERLTGLLNPLRSVAMLLIAIIWFALNVNALLFVVVNAVVWPVTFNIGPGFRTASPTLVKLGRVIGLSWWRMVTDVLFPAALPHTMTGIQVGCGSVAPFLIGRDRGFRTGLVSALNTINLWLLANDARIHSVRDLKPSDKIAVVGAYTDQAFLVRRVAQLAFGDARALDSAMLSMPHPDALLTGQIAAYAGAPPFQGAAVARGARRLASSRELFGPLTFDACFAREQSAKQAAPALKALQIAFAQAIAFLATNPGGAAALLARDGGQPSAEFERQLAEPETVFTSAPAGIEGFGALMLDTKFLRAAAGRLDELTFRL